MKHIENCIISIVFQYRDQEVILTFDFNRAHKKMLYTKFLNKNIIIFLKI